MAKTSMPLTTRISQFAVNFVLRGLILVALALPYRWRIPLMGWLVAQVVAPIAGYRQRIRENLALVMPDLPKAEVERLARAVPNNFGRTLIEIYSGEEFIKRAKSAPVSGPGLAALEQARADGRAVILVTAHLGNYDVARANLIGRGHNMGALYRRMSNVYFNEHYIKSISAIGEPMFEQGRRGMMQLVKHLRAGGVLGILTDLSASDGIALRFFGVRALTSLVTAEMALKYDAVLIPVYSLRAENGLDFEVILREPIPHSTALKMTQAANDDLEQIVRDHMDQWFWIHKRWKYGDLPDRQIDESAL